MSDDEGSDIKVKMKEMGVTTEGVNHIGNTTKDLGINAQVSVKHSNFYIDVGEVVNHGNSIDRCTGVAYIVEIFSIRRVSKDCQNTVLCDGSYTKYLTNRPIQRHFKNNTLKRSKNK